MAEVNELDKKVAHAIYRMLEQQNDYEGAYELVANYRKGISRICPHCNEPQSKRAKKCNSCFRALPKDKVEESPIDWAIKRLQENGLIGCPPNPVQMVPYLADKEPRYNGSGSPCDMLYGACSCGATHVRG